MAWAPGKGVKGKEYKDFWDGEQGTTYIPHEKLPEDVDIEALEEGGVIDDDSMPHNLKEIRQKKEEEKRAKEGAAMKEHQQKAAPLLPTTPVPVVLPQMTSQFGMAPVTGVVATQPIVMPQITMAMGVPPQNTMLMMPPHTTHTLLNTQSLMSPMVASIQGAMGASLQGTTLTGSVPPSVAAVMSSASIAQRLTSTEGQKDERGDKTPTEDEGSKDDLPTSSMDMVMAKQTAFIPPGGAMPTQFPTGAMNSMPPFPPPGFQPFSSRLPIAPHLQPNQVIGGIPQASPWGNASFPRPQGIGVPPFPPGQLGVIPGMPPQLAGSIPSRPLFPSAVPRPSLSSQEFTGAPSPLNLTPKIEGLGNVGSETKSDGESMNRFGNRGTIPQGHLSPHLTQDSPSRGMAISGRGVLGGANAVPLPQELGFRSPRHMNFPPQHGARFPFGPRQQSPFMMRGIRGPRPSVDFRPSNPNFVDSPFEPEWRRRRQFGPIDGNDPYFPREEFDNWDDPRMDGHVPTGRDRDVMEEKLYGGERSWSRDTPSFRQEDDDRRFRSRESRFEDRRRGGGFRERERSRFDDFRGGDRNGSRDWGRGVRDRDRGERSRDRDRERSESWSERDRDRNESWGDRDRDRERDSRSLRRERDRRTPECEQSELIPKPVKDEMRDVMDGGAFAEPLIKSESMAQEGLPIVKPEMREDLPRLKEEMREDLPRFKEEMREDLPRLKEEMREDLPRLKEEMREDLPRFKEEMREDFPRFKEEIHEHIPKVEQEMCDELSRIKHETPEEFLVTKREKSEFHDERLNEFQPKMELCSDVEMEHSLEPVAEPKLSLDHNSVEQVLVENASS